jgi:hypothetical protein
MLHNDFSIINVAITDTITLVTIEIEATKKFDQVSNHLDKIEIIFQVPIVSILVLSRVLNLDIYNLFSVLILL